MDSASSSSPASDRLVFSCSSCGLGLSVGAELAGIEGPCPSCGVVISAPGGDPQVVVIPPSRFPPRRGVEVVVERHRRSNGGRKGMISADSIVDHRRQGQRETTRTLFILTMFILAFSVCLVASWFLKDWIAR